MQHEEYCKYNYKHWYLIFKASPSVQMCKFSMGANMA